MYTISPITIGDQQFEPEDRTTAKFSLVWDGRPGEPEFLLVQLKSLSPGLFIDGQNRFLLQTNVDSKVEFTLRSQDATPGQNQIFVDMYALNPDSLQDDRLEVTVSPD